MRSVILILFETRDDAAIADRAITTAKKMESELVVLTVIDPSALGKTAARLTEQGQVGARPAEGLFDCVSMRHEQLARQQAADIIARAANGGVQARSSVQHGAYAQKTTEILQEENPSAVVIERRPRSLLRRRTSDGFLDQLAENIGFQLIEV